MSHQPIEEMEFFILYESVTDKIWDLACNWPRFAQNTIGEQIVEAADSINANLVEGDGRYTQPDSIRFFIIARGSAREARLWLRRAIKRTLLDAELGERMIADLEKATKLLNLFINYRRSAKFAKESRAIYGVEAEA